MKLDFIPQLETSVVNDGAEWMDGEQANGLMDVWGVCVKSCRSLRQLLHLAWIPPDLY